MHTPEGKVLDGSAGITIVIRKTTRISGAFNFHNIPLGAYRINIKENGKHNTNINFAFVWKKENYDEKLTELLKYIQEKEKDSLRLFGSSFGKLFFRNIKDY